MPDVTGNTYTMPIRESLVGMDVGINTIATSQRRKRQMGVRIIFNLKTNKWYLDGAGVHEEYSTRGEAERNLMKAKRKWFEHMEARRNAVLRREVRLCIR